MNTYMEEAKKEAYAGIKAHEGGPFGAVIVKAHKIVGRGHNRVLLRKDPTCHGEMEAIRDAAGLKTEGGAVIFSMPVDSLIGIGRFESDSDEK